MIAPMQEEMRLARRELAAARRDWTREFRHSRETLRYEDLLPVAQRLDGAFKRFMRATQPFSAAMKKLCAPSA